MANKSKPLSAVDSAWLHMEDSTNLMMVTGIMLFDGPIDYDRFRRTLESRLLPLDRFTMRVIDNHRMLSGPHWEPDPHFDLDAHIHRVALPSPGDMAALQTFLSDLASTPLDFSKPLWQMHLVENVLGGSAMVLRFHHCIGDGTAMNAVLYRMMDTTPDAPIERPEDQRGHARHGAGPLDALLKPARSALDMSVKLAGTVLDESIESLLRPTHLLELTGAATASATTSAATLRHLLLMPPDSVTPLKGKLGVQKHVAWSQSVPLPDVKQIGQQVGAKVNDVLLTAVAGALRGYLIDRGVDVAGLEIRVVLPVDLRPPERALDLGNEFGLVFVDLPLGMADPQVRLAEIKRRMDAIKRSPEALILFGLLNIVGMTPAQVEEQVVNVFGSKATAVMTNVAGPPQPLYMAGRRIVNMTFWVPQAGRLGMGISILSYAGQVTLGVITDAGLVPDPQAITARFAGELAALPNADRQDAPAEPAAPTAAKSVGDAAPVGR